MKKLSNKHIWRINVANYSAHTKIKPQWITKYDTVQKPVPSVIHCRSRYGLVVRPVLSSLSSDCNWRKLRWTSTACFSLWFKSIDWTRLSDSSTELSPLGIELMSLYRNQHFKILKILFYYYFISKRINMIMPKIKKKH